ncbi:putative tricarboxylic transport membrane protein [Bradyrhizobium diazoefficiens]
MDIFANLAHGFAVALSPINLLMCLIGALVGTLVGVLPGIGTIATVAMLLPITFGLPPVGALIMLAGIYYGAQYGGSTTSILVNIPGEATSVVTAIDGHQMAKQGRAGPALAIAAIGSFFAGCVATVLIAVLGAPLTKLALAFGPAEYFSLMVLGLIFAVVLAKGSVLKAIAMIVLGLLMSMVGSDIETGASRMAFNIPELADGLGFATVAMGVFGFAEIIRNLDAGAEMNRDLVQQKITGLMPTRKDLRDSAPAILRGTVLGSILGILPGGGAVIASFAAYTLEKKIAKNPSRFGRGAIEGVAAPESANNAAAQTSFIPLLTLGIPPNAVMALMVGAMTIHGIVPGPQVMQKQPDLVWGMIASMWIGNLMLIIINLPQPAGRNLGPPAARALPADVPLDRDLLRDRHLLGEQRTGRRHPRRRVRSRRLLADQARFRAGTAAARHGARTADGREPAPRTADLARRLERVPDASVVGGVAGDRGEPIDPHGAARAARQARRGVHRIRELIASARRPASARRIRKSNRLV